MFRNLRSLSFVLFFIFIFSTGFYSFAEEASNSPVLFSDVPKSSYAFNDINSLRSLGIVKGLTDNKFGYGSTITRAEFVTFLVRLMGWELQTPAKGSFSDNQDTGKFYYSMIETALAHGVIKKTTEKFNPSALITREEMAVMIVRCLDYDALSSSLSYLPKPFTDVTENAGYITIARDLGIINGDGTGGFNPEGTALKQDAAAMMMRMYNRLNAPLDDLNGFYAISSSSQKDLITSFSSMSFGWSRLTFDNATGEIKLNTAHDGTPFQEYYVPDGFSDRLTTVRENNIPALLSVYATGQTMITDARTNKTGSLLEYLLSNPETYEKLISDISDKIANTTHENQSGYFDGVVIDFEGMKGDTLKTSFNAFLKALRKRLGPDKKIYVTVPPVVSKSKPYYDGYDYRAIGDIADKVILMAHDYAATKLTESDMAQGTDITPLTPAEEIYYALRSITDKDKGVKDKNKIMLQISFEWIGWQLKDGKTLNNTPDYYGLNSFINLFNSSPTVEYSDIYRNPYLKLVDDTGVEHVVWYEDSRSVSEKIKMAKMFGIKGISIWRLGSIPDIKAENSSVPYMDVWDKIINSFKQK